MRRKRYSIIDKLDIPSLLQELEEWRVAHNLSRAKLAKRLGLRSYVATYYWYKGTNKPYPRHIWRIVKLLGKKLSVEDYKDWVAEPTIRQ